MIPPYYTIEVVSPLGDTIDVIENPISISAARSYNTVGNMSFAIPRWQSEDFFRYNTRFKLWRTGTDYKSILFGDTIWFLRRFRNTIDRRYIIEAADSLALLNNPLIAYTSKTPYADKTLEEAALISYTDDFRIDNMMRQYVRENFGPDALDANRINAYITVEPDRHFAPYGEKEASWQKLGAVLNDLARMSAEKGMELFYDLIPQLDSGGFMFKVWRDVRGTDRGFSSVNATVFSDENNDFSDGEVLVDFSEMGTYCYALGYDTGPSQIVEEIGNSDIIRSDPFARIEFTTNVSESDVTSVLLDAGRAALFGARPRRLLTVTLSPASSLRYGIDFVYGDRVGATLERRQYDCQVNAVRMEWREGRERLDIRLDGSETLWNPTWWHRDNNTTTTPTPINPPPPVYQPETPPETTPPDMGLTPAQELVAAIGNDGYVYRTSDFQTPSGSGGPTWDRVNLSISGTVYSWVVDPFSPGYIEGSGAINGWVVNDTDIYRVEDLFGTPSATSVHTFAESATLASGHWRTIQASFGAFFEEGVNPWLLCISHYGNTTGHTGTWALRSLDGGVTWEGETLVSEHYDPGGYAGPMPIGVYTSPKTPGLAYTCAPIDTGTPAPFDGHISTDWGETWTPISGYADDDLVNPLPRMGIWDDINATYTNMGLLSALGVNSFASVPTNGLDQEDQWLMIAPPANAKRVVIEGSWAMSFSRGPGGGTPGGNIQLDDEITINRTDDLSVTLPSANGSTSGTFTAEFTFPGFASGDWPFNRDAVISSTPTNDRGARMRCRAQAFSTGAAVSSSVSIFVHVTEIELDDGTTYAPGVLGDGWLQPENGFAGSIHLPWPDNADEGIGYYGWINRLDTIAYKLIQSVAGVKTDISPTDSGASYGVNHYGFTIRTYDSDRQFAAVAGIGNDAGTDKVGLWVSDDAGATWTNILSPVAMSGNALYGLQIAFSGTNPDVLYTWGGYSNGSIPAISFTDDFGATLDSREGNINSLGTVAFVGIAGGPT